MEFNQNKNKISFQVGLFVLVGLVVLIFGYLWFSNYLEKGSMTHLTIAFPDASGLELGDGVLILGVNRGKVTEINLAGTEVEVSLSVKLNEPLKEGTKFIIRNTTLMGSTRVIIEPGSGRQELDLTEVLTGVSSPGITTLTAQAGRMLSGVEKLIGELNTSDNVISKYSAVADSLQSSLSAVNQLIGDNQAKVGEAVANLSDLSSMVLELIESNQKEIDGALSGSDDLIANLSASSDSIRALTGKLSKITDQLKDENSTFSELTSDDELYLSLLDSVSKLDSLLTDIKKNPKKYLTIEIF